MACSQKYVHEDLYLQQFRDILELLELPPGFTERMRSRIRTLFGNEQAIYERARGDLTSRTEDVKRRKKNLVLKLIDAEKTSRADVELYESVKIELDADEQRLNEELARAESKIASVVRTVEISTALAASCSYAFEKAKEPALQALLARTLFKRLDMRDGKIVRVTLNEPLDFICYPRLKKYPVFDLAAALGDDGT